MSANKEQIIEDMRNAARDIRELAAAANHLNLPNGMKVYASILFPDSAALLADDIDRWRSVMEGTSTDGN